MDPSPQRYHRARLTALIVLGFLTVALAGCSYTCHTYLYTQTVLEGDHWRVAGKIVRSRPEGWRPGPGSWPHWAADPDDRYTLELVPTTDRSDYWTEGRVDILDARLLAPADSVPLTWARVTGHAFQSEPFHIPTPVPDSLAIEFDLALIDSSSNDILRVFHVRAVAVIERHRRWDIADMAES